MVGYYLQNQAPFQIHYLLNIQCICSTDLQSTWLTALWHKTITNQLHGEEAFLRNSSPVRQKISRILRNPKVHYRVHTSPAICPIVSQTNPVRVPLSYSLKRRILTLSSHLCLGLPSRFFSPFSNQNPACTSCTPPHTCHMPRPSHPPLFNQPNNIWWAVQIMTLVNTQSSPVSCYFLHFRAKLLSTLFTRTLGLCSYLNLKDHNKTVRIHTMNTASRHGLIIT